MRKSFKRIYAAVLTLSLFLVATGFTVVDEDAVKYWNREAKKWSRAADLQKPPVSTEVCKPPPDPEFAAEHPTFCLQTLKNVSVSSYRAHYQTGDNRRRYSCRAEVNGEPNGAPATYLPVVPYDSDDSAVNLCSLLQAAAVSRQTLDLEVSSIGSIDSFILWKATLTIR